MKLFPELEKRYTTDPYTAREAQRMAEVIAFGPIVFQASRLMVKYGILEALRAAPNGLTMEETAAATGLDMYTVKCLMEAALCIGTVLVDPATDRFTVSKVGWFLLNDEANRVNMDFNHDVNYEGFFRLDESFREHKPAGLRHFGDWKTIYEGLSSLPEQVRKSWFGFDHFYSDNSFERALEIVFDRPVRNLLDVGGNTGKWALQCVAHDPAVEVTILDLPQQISLMEKETAGRPGAGRIRGKGIDMLDPEASFPDDREYDVIWMSQFLDCFSEEEILSILSRAARIMAPSSRLCIMELLWDRQRFEPAAFCLTMTSLYFTAMANGNSKMYYSEDLTALVDRAGLVVEEIIDGIGQGHNILVCRTRNGE
ncbi:MAG: methyltransferase domain-containing protein [Bacteroidales bacterium]|jgi:ubiquinone/menaquinone biosynthesis C-methylase UbiE|nr:methyltransferase domain-containing protein [Bacteroidales bacterium]